MRPGLVVGWQDPRRALKEDTDPWVGLSVASMDFLPLFICVHLFLLHSLSQKVFLLQIHFGLKYTSPLAAITSSRAVLSFFVSTQ